MTEQGTLYAGGPLQPEGSSAGSLPLEGKFADRFSDTVTTTDTSYRSKDLSITVTAHTLGEGEQPSGLLCGGRLYHEHPRFRTCFSQDTYGSGFEEHLTKMSRDVQAVLAMNGDSYCYNHQHTAGGAHPQRNGVPGGTHFSRCVRPVSKRRDENLFPPTSLTCKQVMQEGPTSPGPLARVCWTPRERRCPPSIPGIISARSIPRGAIGYYEPGHYCFVVVDGRQTGYSRGVTLEELAQVFDDLGCTAPIT